MKLVVALEHRFTQVGDRMYSGMFGYSRFWRRYLEVFDEVQVLARVEQRDAAPAHFTESSGPGVSWIPVPYYVGPMQYFRKRGEIAGLMDEVAGRDAAFMLRVPGMMGRLLARRLQRRGRPFGVEVVGDPWDVFAPGANTSKLRPVFRVTSRYTLARLCAKASVAAYVTRDALQRRYPPGGWSTHYSSVHLDDADFPDDAHLVERESRYSGETRSAERPWVCAHLGTMSQSYKRQDLLIEAVAKLRRMNVPVELRLGGSGQLESMYRRCAETAGIAEHVTFCGRLEPGAGVRGFLQEADLFVLPSRQEGLPRVVIEAMAQGLPTLASDVGGIGELLDEAEMFPPDQAGPMVEKMASLLGDPQRMTQMVRRNSERAREYHVDVLQPRRVACYERLKAVSGAG